MRVPEDSEQISQDLWTVRGYDFSMTFAVFLHRSDSIYDDDPAEHPHFLISHRENCFKQ